MEFCHEAPLYLIRSSCSASSDEKCSGQALYVLPELQNPRGAKRDLAPARPHMHARIRPCTNLSWGTTRFIKANRLRYEFYKLLEYRAMLLFVGSPTRLPLPKGSIGDIDGHALHTCVYVCLIISKESSPILCIPRFDLVHLYSKSISGTFIHYTFADQFKAKMAIMHITSDQTDSEQFQLVNMETSSSAYGNLPRVEIFDQLGGSAYNAH